MTSVKQIHQETVVLLSKIYDHAEATNMSMILLEDCFDVNRSDLLADVELAIDLEVLEQLRKRLLDYEPLQYVTEKAHFYGHTFKVGPGVLIPRPETEELVDRIVSDFNGQAPRILDIGVGSGCIAIALHKKLGGQAYGVDVSEEALEYAQENANLLGADIGFVKSDILTEDLDLEPLDIIVSNPPYVLQSDQSAMHRNVLSHEPEESLFVPDDKPLLFYERIAQLGKSLLKEQGKLYFEIHERFAAATRAALSDSGYLDVQVFQDMQGKDRMIRATNSANR